MAAVHAGHGTRTAGVMEREAAGTASAGESNFERRAYHATRDRQRLEAFRRHSETYSVDPSEVHDTGSSAGTPGAADWLYPDNAISGYMVARAKRGPDGDSQ